MKKTMKTETIYTPEELEWGVCSCCGDETDEILIGDGRCIDCIEDEKFYIETMRVYEKSSNEH